MSAPAPVAKGWHPDPETGGTRYSDGTRWTGDVRPRRRPFAPASSTGPLGYLLVFIAVMFLFLSIMAFGETHNAGYLVGSIVLLLVSLPACVYLARGQGPSTAEVEARLAAERKEAKAKRRAANMAGFAAGLAGLGRPRAAAEPASSEAAEAEQIRAIADPETAKALQSLQHLLYAQVLTEEEFQGAKDKLLGTRAPADSFEQIRKLAELHEAGILGDVEFAAAKARALGL